MHREQTGYVYRRHGWWILRYRQTIKEGDELKMIQRAVRLVPYGPHYKTKRSVAEEAGKKLKAINRENRNPETVVYVRDFVERIYLPYVESQKRPSTAKGYRDVWQDHCEMREDIAGKLLCHVRTTDVQRWLETIAGEDRTKEKAPLRRETLKRIKSTFSGIFRYAKQQGYFDGHNPVTDTAVPRAPAGQITYAYTLSEINRMLAVVLSPAGGAILAVAAYTGLRRGEIEGLRWEDWQNDGLWITRSMWNKHILEPKTQASAAPVPVIASLAERLRSYREYLGNPTSGTMFPGARDGKPVSLNNVLCREIKPVLNRCAECGKAKAEHISATVDHNYRRDERTPEWRGWHAFRRGLATNLHDLGVDDKTIQAILRHSNVSVTQRCYIKSLPKQSQAAMQQLETALCAERARKADPEPTGELIN